MSTHPIGPFGLPGHWYKGNLHTHTTQSDGEKTPEEAVSWYRTRGYDFLAITDHWVLTDGRRVDDAFITITGSELHGDGYHLLCLGPGCLPDYGLADKVTAIVNAVVSSGGLAFCAHPRWTPQPAAAIAPIQGIAGIEVFNSVCEEMDGLGFSQLIWDELLGRRCRTLALAVDDVHWRKEHCAEGKGYVLVRSDALEERAILSALAQGRYYSSMGPRIDDLRVIVEEDAVRLHIRCSPCQHITFYAHGPRGHRFTAGAGETLDAASLTLHPEQVFVRVECQDRQGRVAWTNPLFLADLDSLR